ncbi:uncharacterized protein LOC116922354 [Daphnia magna]|uniref:uncharacterized protein LOC116922354 n=1 Tax=Daphnia magna TaxID=35525 RepID=UPI001E1BB461|nr:uncharacterized protein LOC116922354 [Daphnia magna]
MMKLAETICCHTQLDGEAQAKYIDKHEEFVDRYHKMVIDWRKRRPTEEDLPEHSDNEEEITQTTAMDAAQAATAVAQATTQAINTIALQPQQKIMSIAHPLPRIEFDLTEENNDKEIEILNRKYNRPRSTKTDHYIAITELPRVDRVEDYKATRKLHDQAMGHALNLGHLETASEQNEAISEIVTRKLPLELVSRWHGETRTSRKTLKDLFTFIDSVAEDWEYAFSTRKQPG